MITTHNPNPLSITLTFDSLEEAQAANQLASLFLDRDSLARSFKLVNRRADPQVLGRLAFDLTQALESTYHAAIKERTNVHPKG